jgi:hypothetical protein
VPARLNVAIVREAVGNLLTRRTHPAIAGYFALCERATAEGSTRGLRPNFKGFFDSYLAVEGGPPGRPYYRPFWHQGSSKVKAWYQSNVAGSFSPRSAARIPPFTACVEVDVDTGTFSLRPGHQELALQHLAFAEPLAVLDLAVFLLREYEFPSTTVTTADLIDEFLARFALGRDDGLTPLLDVPAPGADLVDVFVRS